MAKRWLNVEFIAAVCIKYMLDYAQMKHIYSMHYAYLYRIMVLILDGNSKTVAQA